jgi:hypothetical protein
MQALKLTIRETINAGKANAERKKIGDVEIFVPTKDEVLPVIAGAVIAQAEDDNGKKLIDSNGKPVPASDEDGYPIYEDAKANWLFGAIITAVKAQARSRLQKGTVTLKDGLKIATTLEELATAAGRDGGAALAAMRDCREEFAKWTATTGKSAATQETLAKLFKNREALSTQNAVIKGKMKDYVEQFSVALSESDAEKLERFTRTIEAVLEACQGDAIELE